MAEILVGVIDLGFEDGEAFGKAQKEFLKQEGLRPQFCLPKDHHPGWNIYSNVRLADFAIKSSCFSDPAHAYIGQDEFEKIKNDAIRYGVDFYGQDGVFESDGKDCATLGIVLDWLFEILTQEGEYEFFGMKFKIVEFPHDLDDEDKEEYESL